MPQSYEQCRDQELPRAGDANRGAKTNGTGDRFQEQTSYNLDVGHIAENLAVAAVSLTLASYEIGAIYDDRAHDICYRW